MYTTRARTEADVSSWCFIYIYIYWSIHTFIKHYKTVCVDNKMSRPMTALTDINLRAYSNIKHKT